MLLMNNLGYRGQPGVDDTRIRAKVQRVHAMPHNHHDAGACSLPRALCATRPTTPLPILKQGPRTIHE